MKKTLFSLAVVAAIAGCEASTPDTKKVFVCESDGELTEQHWDVKQVRYHSAGMYTIYYVDGEKARYRQHEGETCKVEPVRIHIE